MLILLPVISLGFLLLIFQTINRNWRDSLLSSLIVWGVILTTITELLSLVSLLKFEWVVAFWTLIDIILIIIYFRFYQKRKTIGQKSSDLTLQDIFNLPLFSKILLSGVAFIVAAVGLVAIVAPPSHSDSMKYGMSRVANWVQNHSIAHYPTHNPLQLYLNPWSEFAITHFQILSGGDHFANLIEWGSMFSSIIGVSLIASRLGANLRGQILAAVVCATLPIGILQGSSAKSDYVVALWLVCFAYFTLLVVQKKDQPSIADTFRLGASLGLAFLTKGTAYTYALPFCIWLALWGIKNLRWQVWKPILVVLLIVVAINFGYYTRNLILFGSLFGLATDVEKNEAFSIALFISSVSKNLALHADIVRNLGLQNIVTPTTGITEKIIKILHGVLGVDVNDPRMTSPRHPNFYVPALSRYEGTASNPLHFLLILLASIFLIINKKLRRQPYLITYFIAVLAGFFLFCFLLKWSPERNRLHLPLFVLFSAFVGIVLSKSLSYRITNFLAIILLLLSHSWVFNNLTKPLIGDNNIFNTPRIVQYFNNQPQFQSPYTKAANIIKSKKCLNVGLILETTPYEYPLWILLQQAQEKVIIRHVNVTNDSAKIANQAPYNSFKPCAIISVSRNTKKLNKTLVSQNNIYDYYWSEELPEDSVRVFIPQSPTAK